MSTILKKKAAPVFEQSLEQMYYEYKTINDSIKDLSDSDLYDNCMFDIQEHQRHDLDALYDKLALGGKLTPQERKEVEAFYILANMDFLVNE